MRLAGFTADAALGRTGAYRGGTRSHWRSDQLRLAYRIPFEGVAALPTATATPGVAALPALAAPGTGVQAPSVQGLPCLYGRWCGPGCSGPGTALDNLDRCCQAHDRCYETRGYFACSCDRALLGCVAPITSIWTYKGRWAITIWTAFASKVAGGLCNPFA